MIQTQNHSKQLRGQFFQRSRGCLLKGCERMFYPFYPSSRYCGIACQDGARRWSRKRAQETYQRSLKGKIKRRAQQFRYRQRLKIRTQREEKGISEGDRNKKNHGVICARAGCYERIITNSWILHKKYCALECLQAVRRVLARERWRRIRAGPECFST